MKQNLPFIVSISAGERGFLIDKSLLENHGSTLDEDTILALKLVMDMLIGFGVSLCFSVSKDLLISVKRTRDWYHTDVEAKKAAKGKKSEQKAKSISGTQV